MSDIHSQIARAQTRPTVTQVLERMQPDIAKALPKGLDPDRVSRIALTLIRQSEQNKLKGIAKTSLAECTPESFAGSLLTTVALGLEPGIGGEAYLIPYRDRRAGTVECQLIIGYQGLVKLFRQHPAAMNIGAHTVYSNDFFDYAHGSDAYLKHRPAVGERGEPVAYYADAKLRNGAYEFVVLSPDEVKALRAGKVGPSGDIADPMRWMERKTALRQLLKMLPKSTEMTAALDADEQAGSTLVRQIPTPAAPVVESQQFQISQDQTGQQVEQVDPATGEVLGWAGSTDTYEPPAVEPQPQQGQAPVKKASARPARSRTAPAGDGGADDDSSDAARSGSVESPAGQVVGPAMSGDDRDEPAGQQGRGAGGGDHSDGGEAVESGPVAGPGEDWPTTAPVKGKKAAAKDRTGLMTVRQQSMLMAAWADLSMMDDRDERMLVTNILLGYEPGTVETSSKLSVADASRLIDTLTGFHSRDDLDRALSGQAPLVDHTEGS